MNQPDVNSCLPLILDVFMPVGLAKQIFSPFGFEVLTLARERLIKNTVVKCDISSQHGSDVLRALAVDQRTIGLVFGEAFPTSTRFPAKAWRELVAAAEVVASRGFVFGCVSALSLQRYSSLQHLMRQNFQHREVCACAFHLQPHAKVDIVSSGLPVLQSLLSACPLVSSSTSTPLLRKLLSVVASVSMQRLPPDLHLMHPRAGESILKASLNKPSRDGFFNVVP
eukprot:6462041-Amphidinium_carterae.1